MMAPVEPATRYRRDALLIVGQIDLVRWPRPLDRGSGRIAPQGFQSAALVFSARAAILA